jgi:hypothetical protein
MKRPDQTKSQPQKTLRRFQDPDSAPADSPAYALAR